MYIFYTLSFFFDPTLPPIFEASAASETKIDLQILAFIWPLFGKFLPLLSVECAFSSPPIDETLRINCFQRDMVAVLLPQGTSPSSLHMYVSVYIYIHRLGSDIPE